MSWELVELSTGGVYYRGPEVLRRATLVALRQGPLGLCRVVFDLKKREIIGCANPAESMVIGPMGERLIEPEAMMGFINAESRQEHEEYLRRAATLADGEALTCRVQHTVPGLGTLWLNHITSVLVRDPDDSVRLLATDLLPDA